MEDADTDEAGSAVVLGGSQIRNDDRSGRALRCRIDQTLAVLDADYAGMPDRWKADTVAGWAAQALADGYPVQGTTIMRLVDEIVARVRPGRRLDDKHARGHLGQMAKAAPVLTVEAVAEVLTNLNTADGFAGFDDDLTEVDDRRWARELVEYVRLVGPDGYWQGAA